MEERFSAAYSTQPTLLAVELLLGGIVLKELAHHAVVCTKLHTTVTAAFCHRLPGITESAYDLLYIPAV